MAVAPSLCCCVNRLGGQHVLGGRANQLCRNRWIVCVYVISRRQLKGSIRPIDAERRLFLSAFWSLAFLRPPPTVTKGATCHRLHVDIQIAISEFAAASLDRAEWQIEGTDSLFAAPNSFRIRMNGGAGSHHWLPQSMYCADAGESSHRDDS